MAEKLLFDYELYKSSVDYYNGLLECDNLAFEARERQPPKSNTKLT